MLGQQAKFKVVYLQEAFSFLEGIPAKAREKLISNIRRSTYLIDQKFFKKLEGSDIWEFRCLYGKLQYRLLAF